MKRGLEMSRQAISQHLDVLEAAGLVTTERDGRYKFHYLDTGPLRASSSDGGSRTRRSDAMRIVVTSVYVDDQEKALAFYTDVLGFTKKEDVPMGEYRWLTLDAHVEYERLKGLGVRFTQPPAEMGPVVMAVFDDTCGNLIQIAQRRELS